MKKLIMAAIVLSSFAISLALVQISCSKSTAQPTAPTVQINKIVYAQYNAAVGVSGIYTANYDGTGQTRVNFTLPSGYGISNQHQPALSPDGTKLFFIAITYPSTQRSIFSCNINGTNLIRIVDCPTAQEVALGGAY